MVMSGKSPENDATRSSRMSKKQARRVLQEIHKRSERKKKLRASEALFEHQQRFVNDPSNLKAAVCSRRGGKSFAIAFGLLKAGFQYERSTPLYILMSRADAKNILWPPLRMYDSKYQLGLEFKEHSGDVVLPNGSRILSRGAGSRREIDKLRGPSYPAVVVDEAQAFGSDLEYVIDDAVGPAVAQFGGWIALTGTPNAACAGPFHRFTTEADSGWSVHSWTWRDNPTIDIVGWVDNLRKRRGWSVNHPTFLREYCGKWVRDAEGLVYEYDTQRNSVYTFDEGSSDDWAYVLGIDIGFNDPTAFVLMAYSRTKGRATIVESYKEEGLYPSSSAVHVEKFMRRYNLETIVADTGGMGKGYAEEWVQRFGIPVKPAQKVSKMAYVQFLNGDFTSGNLTVARDRNAELIEEISILQWDSNKMLQNIWEQDRNFDNHLADAMLYAWRECNHSNLHTEYDAPMPGTADYWAKEEERMFEETLSEVRGSGDPWWMGQKRPTWP